MCPWPMTSHTMCYDVICRYLWCHMPLLHTYDIIGHCMWCHRSCNQFVIHDVIAVFIFNLIRICANVPNISSDMPMTSHTIAHDVIAHGMLCHRSCNHFIIYDVIAISVIDFEILAAFQQHAYDVFHHDLWHHRMYDMTSYMTSHTNVSHDTFIHDGSFLPSRRLLFVSAPFSLLSLILFCRILSVSATDIGRGNDLP